MKQYILIEDILLLKEKRILVRNTINKVFSLFFVIILMKITLSRRISRVGITVVAIALIGGGYWYYRSTVVSPTIASAMVVEQVSTGTVSTGIQTTGKIQAAEILDLNVYKLTNRIDTVAVQNGGHVEAGQLLYAFDQSDVAVAITDSRLSIQEAQLALETKKAEVQDPNTTITSLKNDIAVLERNLLQYKDDLRTALRTVLNANLKAVPSGERYDEQIVRTVPTVGGVYTGVTQGEYRIEVYGSASASGLSYNVSGLESSTHELFPGSEVDLGTRGLTIKLPTTTVKRDVWIVAVPNTYAPEYKVNVQDYNDRVAQIKESVNTDTVTLANKRVLLEQAQRGDTSDQRNLDVETASLAIDKAKVNLQKGLDTKDERRIVAPFSGTVEGVENVVVGATPTKDSNDAVKLGSLISDDFLATFSLSANDVDTVSLGQKVLVTLTSVPGSEPMTGEITKINSLPDSSTVAQYEVSARILNQASSTVRLRDGMLAGIEIVQKEKEGVVRVPVASLHYTMGKAYVTVVEGLTAEQEKQFTRLGIVRTDVTVPTTYEREVTVGLRGTYYVEITDGLAVGDRIKVSASASAGTASSTVVRTGFGAGGGTRPPHD